MKECIVHIPFFTNKENEQYLLEGYKISNRESIPILLSEMKVNLNKMYVYKSRVNKEISIFTNIEHESEWPDNNDFIVGEVVGIHKDELDINITDTLYYSKLNDPKIRINGYMIINKDAKEFILTKITRLTIFSSQNNDKILF